MQSVQLCPVGAAGAMDVLQPGEAFKIMTFAQYCESGEAAATAAAAAGGAEPRKRQRREEAPAAAAAAEAEAPAPPGKFCAIM